MRFSIAILAAIGLAAGAAAQDTFEPEESSPQFILQTKFLDSSSALPVVLNTQTTKIEVSIKNEEDEEAIVQVAGGALFDIGKEDTALANITAVRVGPISVPPHTSASIPYSFVLDREPKDYFLRIGLLVEYKGNLVQYLGYNSTVTVQDPPISFFDPQMLFLYLILTGILGGTGYLVYNSYLKSYFFPKKPAGRKRINPVATSPEPSSTASAVDAKGYDESWIPEHHLRPKSPKPRAVKKTKKTT